MPRSLHLQSVRIMKQARHIPHLSAVIRAALSDTPSVKGLADGPTTATLRFLKPASATDQDTIAYRAQV